MKISESSGDNNYFVLILNNLKTKKTEKKTQLNMCIVFMNIFGAIFETTKIITDSYLKVFGE